VSKRVTGGTTVAEVRAVEGESRELEVARMLGDAEDRALRSHAAELLKRGRAAARA
jgi:DNA repair ATPase RecN